MLDKIEIKKLKGNDYFAIIKEPFPKKQHHNQQKGLDKYVNVLNLSNGIICEKKLYLNTKGLHFKHSGYPPSYLADMDQIVYYVPYQVIR